MSDLFLKIVNMSISASWLVLAVLLLRLVLKKAPKWANVMLWGIVAVRLVFPCSIESALSLIPSAETISPGIMMDTVPSVQTGVPAINSVINPVIGSSLAPAPGASANPLQIWIPILSIAWVVGVVALLLYTAISYWRLQRKVSEAVILRDNIYQSENAGSPFVLGVFKPRIYLPYNMDEQDLNHVVAHEQAHIRRRDHWWKPLGFLLLTIHWFNPLMWLAYVLLCRDIELACDEKVIKELGNEQRADYTQALVACSVNRRMIAACPLAFGEVGVKERVKSVMNYKKPAFWVIVLAVIACAVVAVCFLTDPETKQDLSFLNYENLVSVAAQSDTHPAAKSDDQSRYIIDGPQLAQFLDKASWTAQTGITRSVQRNTDKNSKSSIQITLNGTYLKVFDTNTANIYDPTTGKDRYYRMTDGDYEKLLAMLSLDNEGTADNAVAGKTYVYEGEGIMGSFTITLYDDGTFTYYEGMASSYIGVGSWEQDGNTITMTDDGHGGYGFVNHFRLDGDDLVFVDKDSANFVYVKVKDGEKFHHTGEAFKQNNNTDGSVQIMPSQKLSLNDVIMLSQKGYELSWSDFEQFKYIETGSGLYIRVYEINEMYELWIGGSWIDEDPMYIYLALTDDLDTRIDIRDGGVTEFIGADHSEALLNSAIYDAIINCNRSEKTLGLYHCASFVMLGKEEISGTPVASSNDHVGTVTVYGLALHHGYDVVSGNLQEVEGSHTPVAITFNVKNGKYSLKEYWRPGDGAYYASDIREKFPDEIEDDAMDTQKYILAQIQECRAQAVATNGIDTVSTIEQLFEIIESSPATSSRPADYIDAHPIEYRELTYYGSYTLRYVFSKFLEGGQTGLRGHLMRSVLDDLAPEAQLRLYAETGQEYFDEWKAGAIRISEQHDMEWIEKHQPAIWLLLQMIDE